MRKASGCEIRTAVGSSDLPENLRLMPDHSKGRLLNRTSAESPLSRIRPLIFPQERKQSAGYLIEHFAPPMDNAHGSEQFGGLEW